MLLAVQLEVTHFHPQPKLLFAVFVILPTVDQQHMTWVDLGNKIGCYITFTDDRQAYKLGTQASTKWRPYPRAVSTGRTGSVRTEL